jgi:hypothetical protein
VENKPFLFLLNGLKDAASLPTIVEKLGLQNIKGRPWYV